MTTTNEIDVRCVKCDTVACSSNNEWRRLGDLLITPTQKTSYNTINISKGHGFWPLGPVPKDLHARIICEASCAQCGNVLGQGFGHDKDNATESDVLYYDETAVRLKNPTSQLDVIPVITQRSGWGILRSAGHTKKDQESHEQNSTIDGSGTLTLEGTLQTVAENRDLQNVLSRFAQQDADIKKLSRNLESLQDRMLTLEKSMLEISGGLQASSTDGLRIQQDNFVEGFETMLRAMKEASSTAKAMEDLRLENEQLKQAFQSITAPAPAPGEADCKSVGTANGMILRVPSEAPTAPQQKKRHYSQRKPRYSQGSVSQTRGDSNFASNNDQDGPSQLGGLAALKEITAAMAQGPSTDPSPMCNNNLKHDCSSSLEGTSTKKLLDGIQAFSNLDENAGVQPNKRRRTGEDISNNDDVTEPYARTTEEATDSVESSQANSQSFTLQKSRCRQSLAAPFETVGNGMDEMMIDPALRSTTGPSNQTLSTPDVLASIENPPDRKQKRKSTQPEKPHGAPQYDSEHERRIKEYKARDALRKRKTRAISTEKKKMDGEDKFKQEEKIRARDRMVKELMEREEMLEKDDDF